MTAYRVWKDFKWIEYYNVEAEDEEQALQIAKESGKGVQVWQEEGWRADKLGSMSISPVVQ